MWCTPITRLPQEVICLILDDVVGVTRAQFNLPARHSWKPDESHDILWNELTGLSAVPLGHVCGPWREALRHVRIPIRLSITDEEYAAVVEQFEHFTTLSRTGLILSLICWQLTNDRQIESLKDIVHPHSGRLSRLTLNLSIEAIDYFLVSSPELPALWSLSIAVSAVPDRPWLLYGPADDSKPPLRPLAALAPALNTFKVKCMPTEPSPDQQCRLDPLRMGLAIAEMRELAFMIDITTEHVDQLLRVSSRLERLTVTLKNDPDGRETDTTGGRNWPQHRVSAMELTSVTDVLVVCRGRKEADMFLHGKSMPALKSFGWHAMQGDAYSQDMMLKVFVGRDESKSPLTVLELRGMDLPSGHFKELLLALPSLTTLTLDDCRQDWDIALGCEQANVKHKRLQNLSHLTCWNFEMNHLERLLQFIESRCQATPGTSTLVYINLLHDFPPNNNYYTDEEDLGYGVAAARIRNCAHDWEEKGIEVELTGPPSGDEVQWTVQEDEEQIADENWEQPVD